MRIYPKRIDLDNRYNEEVYLEQLKGGQYKFVAPNSSYIRCVFDEDNKTLHTIDPSGGPFIPIGITICVDEKLLEVSRIFHSLSNQCFVVELKFSKNEKED